jgi:hypothetical protein
MALLSRALLFPLVAKTKLALFAAKDRVGKSTSESFALLFAGLGKP